MRRPVRARTSNDARDRSGSIRPTTSGGHGDVGSVRRDVRLWSTYVSGSRGAWPGDARSAEKFSSRRLSQSLRSWWACRQIRQAGGTLGEAANRGSSQCAGLNARPCWQQHQHAESILVGQIQKKSKSALALRLSRGGRLLQLPGRDTRSSGTPNDRIRTGRLYQSMAIITR